MDNRIEKILITEQQIKAAIDQAATWINETYQNTNLVIVTVLKGSIPFVGALMPKITVDFEVDYICVSSFKGSHEATTMPEMISTFSDNLVNKDVLLVEDIIDSGRTIKKLIEELKHKKCKSIKILTLLDKPAGRTVELIPDYKCFTIPKEFIVGFGLDYKEKLRNLPYIGILKKEIYQK